MSRTASLEVVRSVIPSEHDEDFIERASAFGRAVFDSKSGRVVALRPSNSVVSTVKTGASYMDELSYYHLSKAADNRRHLGSKVDDARVKLEGNIHDAELSCGLSADDRAGKEPLERTLNYAMQHEYGFNPDDLITATFDLVDAIRFDERYLGKIFFVLRASLHPNNTPENMLRRMSGLSHRALEQVDSDNKRVANIPSSDFVDSIPFAYTRNPSASSHQEFLSQVAELLPITVHLTPIDINASS